MALAYGLIPYLGFLLLYIATGGQKVWPSTTYWLSIVQHLLELAAVPWGPFYLFFFGFFFAHIRGRNGFEKGLFFSLIMIALIGLPTLPFLRYFADLIHALAQLSQMIFTYLFVGLLMDLYSLGFDWKGYQQIYGLPGATTVVNVVVTATTTATAVFLTNVVSQAIGQAIGQLAQLFPTSLP